MHIENYPVIEYSLEKLYHFSCKLCNKWFSIGDFNLEEKTRIVCPNCGNLGKLKKKENLK